MKKIYFSCALFSCFFPILYAKELGKPGCLEKKEAISLLETADEFLSKVEDACPSCGNDSECAGKLPSKYIEISKKLISDVKENFPTCTTCPEVKVQHYTRPRDCSEISANGRDESGVYEIWPSESCAAGKQLQVYCDMETDYGGWTVIQRRGKFQVQQDFSQDWDSYKNGFGNITEEFWLGNENIRVLCHKGCEIRFDLQAADGTKGFAVYKNFNLARTSYTLSISQYTGNIGDGMKYHNNKDFSTKDKGVTSFAQTRGNGGWWYNTENRYCQPNGLYLPGSSGTTNVYWFAWRGSDNLAGMEIKVRPK